ncbi:ATP phosphoribosyltransferase regulatory subunit [Litoribrevibacter albus]|uniref:ATP phosphoribosyltransferase regulatory subunit n=1 Tax=Litoribrevibacter albus TaxID=1473156 RepID=A0AA37S8S0_9GAMM|nr:ATP phosphoribosyltransferase regulatory subunit [Litoribrevibacter albus]GLQ30638.1 ATP phosphoribosyltransferase regulatory subunit [Litoribrevibacter albus]
MTIADRWLLPDGVEDILPPKAEQIETLRSKLLDLYKSWGYDQVMPPMMEYLESLLTGVGHDLDTQTFKVTDQLNGRLMGVRADITPQVARIDAHSLAREGVSRFCYAGQVLHTKPAHTMDTRNPIQLGAEVYGHAGIASDFEVIALMLESLKLSKIEAITLDLGHVGVFRSLMQKAALDSDQERGLFDILRRKALPELEAYIPKYFKNQSLGEAVRQLAYLCGGPEILNTIRELVAPLSADAVEAVDALKQLVGRIQTQFSDVNIYIDLSELRGYNYHTGVVFSAFKTGGSQPLASGGRYDETGKVFGRARPATGFSLNLLKVADVTSLEVAKSKLILAPEQSEGDLNVLIDELRAKGHRVIRQLTDSDVELCDAVLTQVDGKWMVQDR